MRFIHVDRGSRREISGQGEAVLVDDGWDDYHFQTLFELVVFTEDGKRIDLGGVKILSRGLQSGRVQVPETFEALSENYCSLGQDANYYETLVGLGEFGEEILRSLRDCVVDRQVLESFRTEAGFQTSLLRSVSEQTIQTTFAMALGGQAQLTPFRFRYTFPPPPPEDVESPPPASFSIDPGSMPPTNVHVIIGRNGVGKTLLLGNIAGALCQSREAPPDPALGQVEFLAGEGQNGAGERFSNLVTITFSAFDPFRSPRPFAVTQGDIRYAYVGLKRGPQGERGAEQPESGITKTEVELIAEFQESLEKCSAGPRLRRWHEAVQTLENDPGFAELNLRAKFPIDGEQRLQEVVDAFRPLSSGHKIVLLTVTRLVELVDERTLVLIDEPEAHLHPPLLSSLVRVLSTLLKRRNAAAIVATHSPVVLQEVPRTCVWVMRRAGYSVDIARPTIETFGENVGVLTREVFGLEVTASGFHQLVSAESDGRFTRYSEVVAAFHGQLGAEARAIVRTLTRPDAE